MKLTAQLTTQVGHAIEYFAYTGPGILDEEDYAPLAEIEHALESTDLEETGQPTHILVRH